MKNPDAQAIVKRVANASGWKPAVLLGPDRTRSIVQARHVAMWLMRRELDLSYSEIAVLFGQHDHSTPISAIHRVDVLLAEGNEWTSYLVAATPHLNGATR